MSRNFGKPNHVGELLGNFAMTIFFTFNLDVNSTCQCLSDVMVDNP